MAAAAILKNGYSARSRKVLELRC